MSRENLNMIGFMVLIVLMAVLVIFFDDIKAMVNEAMMEQADSLVNQLRR
jgi:hypothetical protein